jgi:hypothetical protein
MACRVSEGHLWIPETQPGSRAGRNPPVGSRPIGRSTGSASAPQWLRCIGMYCDPAHWQDTIDRWTSEFGARFLVKAAGPRPLEW